MSRRRRLLVAGQALLSAGLLAFLAWKVDLGRAAAVVLGAHPGWLAAGVAQLCAYHLFTALRWRLVVHGLDGALPLAPALRFAWIAAFFGQVLPASVGGDAVRMWLFWRRSGNHRLAIHGVLLERLVLIVMLLCLVLAIQPGLAARGAPLAIVSGAAAVLAAIILGLVALLFFRRLLFAARWPVLRVLGSIAGDVRRIFGDAPRAALLCLLSLGSHLNTVLAAWLIARGLHLDASLADCAVLVPVAVLGAALPISVAGWGVREGLIVALFALIGVPGPEALALSLLLGAAAIAVAMPGSVLWLIGTRREERQRPGTLSHSDIVRPGP